MFNIFNGEAANRMSVEFLCIFQEKEYVAKNSFIFVSLSFHFKHNLNRWKPAQTTLHGLTTRVKSGLKLLETRSQKGTAGFTYAGFSKLSSLIHFLLQQGLSDTSCVLVGNVLDAPHRRDRFLIGLMLVRGG